MNVHTGNSSFPQEGKKLAIDAVEETGRLKEAIKTRRLRLGIRLFVVLTIIGASVVFYATGTSQTFQALKHFRPAFFVYAFLLILVDLLSGSMRIYIFVRKIHSGKTFRACFEANLANIFFAAATPFQTGGGIAQLYVLNHYGIPYSAGLMVSVFNFTATLSLLFLAATGIFAWLPHHFSMRPSLLLALDFSRAAFYVALILFLLFLLRPSWMIWLFERFSSLFGKGLPRFRSRVSRASERALRLLQDYRSLLSLFWKKHRLVLFWNVLLTVILYFNKCLIAYVLFEGLNLHPGFWKVVMLQMLVVFFLYFAPTPGASLVAETGTSAIMSLIAPAYILSIFAVLWRFFTTYFGVMLGSLVLLRVVGLNEKKGRTQRQ